MKKAPPVFTSGASLGGMPQGASDGSAGLPKLNQNSLPPYSTGASIRYNNRITIKITITHRI